MYSVFVEPDSTAREIREWLREHPEIAKDKYEAKKGWVTGHCYVASEAYFYADGGEDSDLDVYCLSYDDGTHWFLRNGDEIIDLSIELPEHGDKIPYQQATRRAFITGYKPSQRAERINAELDLW
jgi:hypothetical protein